MSPVRNIIIVFFGVILLGGGVIVLQIFLSSLKNKWAGLILPLVCFLISALYSFNVYAAEGMSLFQIILMVLFVFVICNIPTAILIVIYLAMQQRNKKKNQLNKMNIQDLE